LSRMSVRMRCRALVALSAYSVASTCPVSGVTVRCPRVRCPRVRCDRPVSAMSTRPLSNVRVWTSGVRIGVRAFRVRVRCLCTDDSVERVGAAGSHTARRAPRVWPSCRIRERLEHLPAPAWASGPDCLASPRTRRSGWRRRPRSVVMVGGPGPSRLVAASLPTWTATRACGRSAAASCSERRQHSAGDALTCGFRGGGEGI